MKLVKKIVQRIKEEPVLARQLFAAVILVAVSFGLALSATQIAALGGLFALVVAFITRSKVTPVTKIEQEAIDYVKANR